MGSPLSAIPISRPLTGFGGSYQEQSAEIASSYHWCSSEDSVVWVNVTRDGDTKDRYS
jgi:hypothetical protein